MNENTLLKQYETLKTEEDLRSFIREGQREGLHYEYKRKTDFSTPDLSDDDKKNLSKSLGSFANSDGGILIWGIITKEKGDSKLPYKLEPITQVHEFEKRLNNFLLDAIQVPIENLRSDVIYTESSKENGYLKYYVPSSNLAPHRSFSKDTKFDHYYARNSEGCYIMPHYQLADMFGRRQRPELKIIIKFSKRDVLNENMFDLNFSFINVGKSVARYQGFICSLQNAEIVSTTHIQNVSHLNKEATVSMDNNVDVIHPNGIVYNIGKALIKQIDKTKIITLNCTYYCDGMQSKQELYYTSDELIPKLVKIEF